MNVDEIADRLEHKRRSGKGGYIARCPAHNDRSPSLSITPGDDGRVLIHCHAGCPPLDVLAAIGLDWADVFEEDREIRSGGRARHSVETVDGLIIEIAEADIAAGRRLSGDDVERYRAALIREKMRNG